jgi:hypothetical protein
VLTPAAPLPLAVLGPFDALVYIYTPLRSIREGDKGGGVLQHRQRLYTGMEPGMYTGITPIVEAEAEGESTKGRSVVEGAKFDSFSVPAE